MEIRHPNEPKIKDWMSEEEKNFRQHFHQTINEINSSNLLPEQITKYEIFDSGTSSVVALINPENNPSILKTAIESETINNEAICLEHWSQVIRTPKIYFHHPSDENLPSFINMEYITEPRLSDLMEQKVCTPQMIHDVGKSLARIHLLPTPNLTNPDIVTFDRTAKSALKNTHDLIKKEILIPSTLKKIEQSLQCLSTKPWITTVCHMDFLPYNLFYGPNGLIVFDPNISIAPNLRDLANTTFILKANNPDNSKELSEAILSGYQSVVEIDLTSFQAFENIVGIKKIINWLGKDSHKKLEAAIKLLNQN